MAVVKSSRGWDALLGGEGRKLLEREALPPFLKRQRWFAGKARAIESVRLVDTSAAGELPDSVRLVLIEVGLRVGPVRDVLRPARPGRRARSRPDRGRDAGGG